MDKIGFIGSGNMAEALIKGIIAAQVFKPENIFISDIRPERLKLLAETITSQAVKITACSPVRSKSLCLVSNRKIWRTS